MKGKSGFVFFAMVLGVFLLSAFLVTASHAQDFDGAEITYFNCDGFAIGTNLAYGISVPVDVDFQFELVRTSPPGTEVTVSGFFKQESEGQLTFFSWGDFPDINPTGETYVLPDGALADGNYDIPTIDVPDHGRTAGTVNIAGSDDFPLHFSEPPITCEQETELGAFTPGFWKNHHSGSPSGHDAWQYTDFETGEFIIDIFDIPDCNGFLSELDVTLLDALNFGGGAGVSGAARILLRAAVASLLNASFHKPNGDNYFPYDSNSIIDLVNAALDSCDREAILDLADNLDMINNSGSGDIDWGPKEPKPKNEPKKGWKGSSIVGPYWFEPDTGISSTGNAFNSINGWSATLLPSWQQGGFEGLPWYQNGITRFEDDMRGPWWWQASLGMTSVGPIWYQQYQNAILGPAWYQNAIWGGPWWELMLP